MHAFMTRIAEKFGVGPNYSALHAWSIEHRQDFWAEMLTFAEIESTTEATATSTGEGMLDTKWFPGMTFNFAAHRRVEHYRLIAERTGAKPPPED